MNVAFIPVRGGSKSIPLKNIKLLGGMPLVYWTAKAACECSYIDKVYVATDNDEIKKTVNMFKKGFEAELFSKLEVVNRSEESATDTASTEFAMLEFAKSFIFDNIVLIQATSPLLKSDDLNAGFQAFQEKEVDSVLSTVRQKRFCWQINEKGYAEPSNYDIYHRPRRQEFDGYLLENGAFYISSKANLLATKNRISGKIKAIEMNQDSYFEMDEADDWAIAEMLMNKNYDRKQLDVSNIKMFLTDCDGCLTDGGMYYSEHGDEMKKFNARDGMGFHLLHQMGILTGIVTSENVELNRHRADKLKLDIYEANCKDKVSAIMNLANTYGVSLENIIYIGDDINDVEIMRMVGYSCAPADAMPSVKSVAQYITVSKGGEGVIREVVERLISGKLY